MACNTGNIPTSALECRRSMRGSFSHSNSPISPVLSLPSCLFQLNCDGDCRQNQDTHHSIDENHADLLGIITESLDVLKQARHIETRDNNDSVTIGNRESTERKERDQGKL